MTAKELWNALVRRGAIHDTPTREEVWVRCIISYLWPMGIVSWLVWWITTSRIQSFAQGTKTQHDRILKGPKGADTAAEAGLPATPQDMDHWRQEAFNQLVLGDGKVVFLSILAAFLTFTLAWYLMTRYLLIARRSGAGMEKEIDLSKKNWRGILHLHALFEPPGEIFTIIGIGFTFLGLSLGLALLPSDLASVFAAGAANGSSSLTLVLNKATLLFGTGISLGLCASLLGVMLSVEARKLHVCYAATLRLPGDPGGPTPAGPTKDVSKVLAKISRSLSNLEQNQARTASNASGVQKRKTTPSVRPKAANRTTP